VRFGRARLRREDWSMGKVWEELLRVGGERRDRKRLVACFVRTKQPLQVSAAEKNLLLSLSLCSANGFNEQNDSRRVSLVRASDRLGAMAHNCQVDEEGSRRRRLADTPVFFPSCLPLSDTYILLFGSQASANELSREREKPPLFSFSHLSRPLPLPLRRPFQIYITTAIAIVIIISSRPVVRRVFAPADSVAAVVVAGHLSPDYALDTAASASARGRSGVLIRSCKCLVSPAASLPSFLARAGLIGLGRDL